MRLIFLTLSLVLFVVGALPLVEPYRVRIISAGLAFMVAAQYPFGG